MAVASRLGSLRFYPNSASQQMIRYVPKASQSGTSYFPVGVKAVKITDMSGHSKWSTIKREKGAKDAARGALFTKLGNAVAMAARGGTDPDTNFTLRLAVDKARAANMPMANIQRSIDRAKDKDAAQMQEVLYEGYGPGGTAILVEAATDNTNRTYPEVRLAFSKHGGNIAEKGAVAFQFDRKGTIRIQATGDDVLLAALDAGAEDVQEEEGESIVYTPPTELARVRDALRDAGLEVIDAELTYVPNTTIEITDKDTAGKIMRLMDALDDIDDVTNTHVNFDIDESLLG
jgi:YebC/PmpR family DNA-binding regulatory protein